MTAAFGTTPLPGGLNELAIMMGNLALESIKFTATHRWGCDWHPEWCDRYYGRGYIQLTGYDNYARAANAIGIDIVNDPDQVANDPVVNWKTVLFYWTDRVQPLFWERGLSLSTSVLAIDPDENCASRGGSTNWDRVALIQCFQDGWLGYHDEGT
ncbi:lysozyme-like domain-containing protein, partial [Obelidium mucronatum]